MSAHKNCAETRSKCWRSLLADHFERRGPGGEINKYWESSVGSVFKGIRIDGGEGKRSEEAVDNSREQKREKVCVCVRGRAKVGNNATDRRVAICQSRISLVSLRQGKAIAQFTAH